MRWSTLQRLRCPRCLAPSLVSEQPPADAHVQFGPVHCLGCGARYSVHEGLVDLVTEERAAPTAVQQAMEAPWVARSWERYLRPAADAVLTGGRLDADGEYRLVRSLLGTPEGAVVDLGCGAGAMLRRLAGDLKDAELIGVDVSRPMLEEALAQAREGGLTLDFVRAFAPPLPFVTHSISAVIAAGLLPAVADVDALVSEVARVLKPRGRLVATTVQPEGLAGALHRRMGLVQHSEADAREAFTRAGLVAIEVVKAPPYAFWKAELP